MCSVHPQGLAGDEHTHPYAILVLFMAMAYVCVSLDMTGLFAWLALHMLRLSRGDGRRLALAVFVLASLTTLVTSNDIVILTLTPIICYFTSASGIDPVPYLILVCSTPPCLPCQQQQTTT